MTTDDFDALVADAGEVDIGPDKRAIEETLLVGLVEPAVAARISQATRPGDFYFDLHRRFADVVFPMIGEGRHVDAVTFRAEAGDQVDDKLLALAADIFRKGQEDPPAVGRVLAYLDIFTQDARRRLAKELVARAGQALAKGDSTPDQVAGEVFRAVADLDASRRLSGVGQTEGEELDAFFGELEARQSAGKDFVGLDTGFTHLNRVANGLTAGLFILGAAPSTGKTTLAKQIADQVVANHPDAACLFVSLEQSKEELRIKTLSRLSGIENRDLQRGRLDPADPDNAWAKVVTAKDDFAVFADRLQVLEGDRATTVDRIRLAALQLRQKTQAGRLLVVVDYLQIVPTDDPVTDARQRVNFVTSELRRLGRDLDASVLAIASVNRKSYGQGGKIDAFKESGDIEFSADIAAILVEDSNNPTKGNANYRGAARNWKRVHLDVVKNRNGERARIELDFYPEVSYFREAGKGTLPED